MLTLVGTPTGREIFESSREDLLVPKAPAWERTVFKAPPSLQPVHFSKAQGSACNAVAYIYDLVGRKATEGLTIGGQTYSIGSG